MKSGALLAVPVLITLAGCPGEQPPSGKAPPAPPEIATPASPTPTTKPAESWAGQAEIVARMLDEVVARVEKNDKAGALEAANDAYFVGYERTERNLEVASMTNLPEEMLDGKPRNVKIVREDLFGQVRSAVKMGAPAAKVRALVDELAGKIREDAKKLDEQKIPPP